MINKAIALRPEDEAIIRENAEFEVQMIGFLPNFQILRFATVFSS